MSEKVYCKDCVCIEVKNEFAMDEKDKEYLCHREPGPPQRVDRYHWCFKGIYRYGDKGSKS